MDLIYDKWQDILNYVRKEHDITNATFDIWLRPLEIESIEEDTVYIAAKDKQYKEYLSKKYTLPIKSAIADLLGYAFEVEFIVPSNTNDTSEKKVHQNLILQAGLNPNYKFETFVVGENNRLAHSAALAVADAEPGEIYNPLFIYGGVGLGKTHLMQSIAHYILEKNPDCRVLYTSSETFTNDIVNSIGASKKKGDNEAISKIRYKYRNIDVLLIDDIQFIIGKERTQEEFFNTFNHLQMSNKQIIISSDKPPKEMNILEERYVTRFEMGLTVDISSPDFETRVAILKKKSYNIDDDVINYIASNVKNNVRELEGALNRLVAFKKLENKVIDLELAKKELKDIISPDVPKEITMDLIAKTVAEHFNITVEDIVSSSRMSYITKPRHIFMYLCSTMLKDVTQENIGAFLGGRNHSTIINGIKNIRNDIENNYEPTVNALTTIQKKIIPDQFLLISYKL